jgi:large subunit ribosomal protein L17
MRHHSNKRKLGLKRKGRTALVRSLALNLIVRGKIKTTEPKAKELRPFMEKLVTQAKKGGVANRRVVASKLYNRGPEVKKLFETIAPKYEGRSGGYTRVVKMGVRKSDGAKMAMIEFV